MFVIDDVRKWRDDKIQIVVDDAVVVKKSVVVFLDVVKKNNCGTNTV